MTSSFTENAVLCRGGSYEDVAGVLLTRALEEADRQEMVVLSEEKETARREALGEAGEPIPPPGDKSRPLSREEKRFVTRRARLLLQPLLRRHAVLRRVYQLTKWKPWLALLCIGAALTVGVAAGGLGPEKQISIISFPLLGLLVWNLAVFVVLVVRWIIALSRPISHFPVFDVSARAFRTFLGNLGQESPGEGNEAANCLYRAVDRFAREWMELAGPVYIRRSQAIFHLSAAAIALGTVAAMYVRGLALEYLAGWESTFLDASAVHTLLSVVLGPASALTGIAVPGVDHIASMCWTEGFQGENAANWIHLYAATALIFIVVPRLALAVVTRFQAFRMRVGLRTPTTDDAYFRRLLFAGQGSGDRARVVPYSFEPHAPSREAIRALLQDLWGGRLTVEFQPPVQYGEEDDYVVSAAGEPAADYLVTLLNMASTPEEENHDTFLKGLKDLIARHRTGRGLLILLDPSGYEERFGRDRGSESRFEERRHTWERFLKEMGLEFQFIDAERDQGERYIEATRSAVWQPA